MSPLAAAAAQHNAADDQQEAKRERDDVPKSREWRRRVRWRREHGIDHSGLTPREGLHDVTATVDDGAYAGRCRADDWKAFFGSPKAGLGEMLRRPPAAKPGVIGRVEDERRAVLFVDNIARKDDFIAELQADLPPLAAEVERAWTGAGTEIEVARRQARQPNRRQQRTHRQVLSVG